MFRLTILNLMHVTVIVGLCGAVARLVAFDTVSLVSAVLWSSIAGLWLTLSVVPERHHLTKADWPSKMSFAGAPSFGGRVRGGYDREPPGCVRR
jgi:hypothetical protein